MKIVTLNKKIRSDFIYDRILKKNLEAILKDYTERLQDAEKNRLIAPKNGTSIKISDSADSRVVSIGVKGNSVQNTTKGYQLLNIPDNVMTVSGVTITIKNGIINFNGTATANVYKIIVSDVAIQSETNQQITFVRNRVPDASIAPPYFLLTIDGTEYNMNNQSSHIDYRTISGKIVTSLKVSITSGQTFNNVITNPLIYIGDYDSSKIFENYTGEIASPNANYEQPILSSGDDKNLFDTDTLIIPRTSRGIEISINSDKSIKLKGTATQNNLYFSADDSNKTLIKKGTYIFTSNTSYLIQLQMKKATSGTTFTVNRGSTITLDEDSYIYNGLIYTVNGTSYDEDVYLKFQEGLIATPYSPYGMGSISEKIVGKQLFQNEYIPIPSNTINAFLKKGTYTIATCDGISFNKNVYIKLFDKSQNIVTTSGHITSVGTTLLFSSSSYSYYGAAGVSYFYFTLDDDYYLSIGLLNSDNTRQVMLVKGQELERNYQAHQEQTYTIPTQQPMRSIGTVRDEFLEGENIERHNLISVAFDGSDDESWSNQFGESLFGINLTNKKINASSLAYCNYFIFHNVQSGLNNNLAHGEFSIQIGTTDTLYIKNTDFTTIADFKNWLKTHHIEVIYQLETPQDLPCTDKQVTAIESFLKARTYKNVTNIYSEDEVPAYIDMTYVRDNETVINNLETRIETLESEG